LVRGEDDGRDEGRRGKSNLWKEVRGMMRGGGHVLEMDFIGNGERKPLGSAKRPRVPEKG
jgi:hypothetical protein